VLGCLLAVASAGAHPTAAKAGKLTAANWDAAAQRQVVKAGLMSETGAGAFNGGALLSAETENQALAGLAHVQASSRQRPESTGDSWRPDGSSEADEQGAETVTEPSSAAAAGVPPPVTTSGTVTVTRFDALLVDQLGLGDVAAHVQQAAQAAGLAPPSYFGTEVTARYLGVRYDHPAGEDSLEQYPWNTITRAEAAHSFAVVLQAGAWALESARQTLEAFSLPHYSSNQLRALRIAVGKIGMPYVWGGTTDGTEDGLEHGGYDCSGFAWRVYKVSGLPWGAKILGRTAAEQAGQFPKSRRIHLQNVQPGDLLFFGSAHFNSPATEANVDHEGIALSSSWAIHSSGQGVYVLPLTTGWLAQQFTWARRVL
jgi:cell wall-associated NlpC family hydrolase